MLLNVKKLAFLGLLLAFTVLLVIASGIVEFNTLFLLAGASFGVGVAIREGGQRLGFGFYIASILLSFILSPNKFYCLTFAAMGLYIVMIEYTFDKLTNVKINRNKLYWVIKYTTFNIMYIPILMFLPKLIYQGNISYRMIVAFFIGGQIVLYIYDRAYNYFQRYIWSKLKGTLHF